MRISLRRANRAFKDAWNDPKWQEPKAPSVPTPTTGTVQMEEEEVRRETDRRLAPIVDEQGQVWRRTIPRTPPWRS